MVLSRVGVIVVVGRWRAHDLTLVGRSFSARSMKVYGRSERVSIGARSALSQIRKVHLTLSRARAVARTSLFSTHHYHGVKIIGPVDKISAAILQGVVSRRLVGPTVTTV